MSYSSAWSALPSVIAISPNPRGTDILVITACGTDILVITACGTDILVIAAC